MDSASQLIKQSPEDKFLKKPIELSRIASYATERCFPLFEQLGPSGDSSSLQYILRKGVIAFKASICWQYLMNRKICVFIAKNSIYVPFFLVCVSTLYWQFAQKHKRYTILVALQGSSPLSTGPGSGLGHSLPNLQAIPRYPSGLDHGRGSHIWLSNQLAHNQRVMSHTNSLSSKDPAAHMEVQSPYSSQTISDGIEEEEESDMAAAALHQARWKQLALAQAQAQMLAMGFSGGQHLKMNTPQQSTSPPGVSVSPDPPNNLLSPLSSALASGTSAQLGSQLKLHRRLGPSLSAPGLSLSNLSNLTNGMALSQQAQTQSPELLQQQHLQFLKQQRQYQQNPARFLQQLQQELLLQQMGAKNLQKNLQQMQEMQQQQLHKESQAALKEHLEQHMQQKEQQAWKEHLLQVQRQQKLQQPQQQPQQQIKHQHLTPQHLIVRVRLNEMSYFLSFDVCFLHNVNAVKP